MPYFIKISGLRDGGAAFGAGFAGVVGAEVVVADGAGGGRVRAAEGVGEAFGGEEGEEQEEGPEGQGEGGGGVDGAVVVPGDGGVEEAEAIEKGGTRVGGGVVGGAGGGVGPGWDGESKFGGLGVWRHAEGALLAEEVEPAAGEGEVIDEVGVHGGSGAGGFAGDDVGGEETAEQEGGGERGEQEREGEEDETGAGHGISLACWGGGV